MSGKPKEYCLDYEIVRCDETNFDVNCCNYVREAYEAKMWAFVNDYGRFKIFCENDNVYFDTDVEFIKPKGNKANSAAHQRRRIK